LENNDRPSDGQLHGASGPLHISSIKAKHELIESVIEAAGNLGIRRTEDFNGVDQEGAGYYQLTTHRGWRVSAARAYLADAKACRNLVIIPKAHATRILFHGRRAVGVSYVRDGNTREIRARRGIVLSAGAVQSPQLLMLSGIGSASQLGKFSVTPLIDRPAVGRNLQDHVQFRLIYRCTKPITTNDALRSIFGKTRIGLQWLISGTGPLAIGINQGGIFTRILPGSRTPDIQFHISTLSADMAGGKPHPFSGFTLSVCQLRPESRGDISLASADPFAPPLIRANYLSAEGDRACAIAAIRFARKLAQTAPLSSYVAEEVTPDPTISTDADILSFAQKTGSTIFHPVGTCRMGSDEDAVVDPRLRVRGAENLWVVDCSIMPMLTSGNTNLPAIMIGEKASDMIAEDSRV
jgi:choline dehydrogenase